MLPDAFFSSSQQRPLLGEFLLSLRPLLSLCRPTMSYSQWVTSASTAKNDVAIMHIQARGTANGTWTALPAVVGKNCGPAPPEWPRLCFTDLCLEASVLLRLWGWDSLTLMKYNEFGYLNKLPALLYSTSTSKKSNQPQVTGNTCVAVHCQSDILTCHDWFN